jgi:hypothetical protein
MAAELPLRNQLISAKDFLWQAIRAHLWNLWQDKMIYLKLSKLRLALLMNFNVKTLKEHIHRIVNNL